MNVRFQMTSAIPASATATCGARATKAAVDSAATAVPTTSSGSVPSKRRPPNAALPHQSCIDALKYTIAPKVASAAPANSRSRRQQSRSPRAPT
jgi:hypothetical protein